MRFRDLIAVKTKKKRFEIAFSFWFGSLLEGLSLSVNLPKYPFLTLLYNSNRMDDVGGSYGFPIYCTRVKFNTKNASNNL